MDTLLFIEILLDHGVIEGNRICIDDMNLIIYLHNNKRIQICIDDDELSNKVIKNCLETLGLNDLYYRLPLK